jgi:hypothetical protein
MIRKLSGITLVILFVGLLAIITIAVVTNISDVLFTGDYIKADVIKLVELSDGLDSGVVLWLLLS